ncbi:SDR family NAD(P)-dependent oxidoreductase [Georgenia subflava]|uniref:Glucose 1-dehydrogenase n=1 Tax=Georgenia subflava TaxID=1622177 RepID=A0A6N7EFW7_9MICO|nr:glucose 1-dehydrogenase [Georgenia subflava]MPV35567.1 glucose 1-dehydrogenase [Georgenia subflava]
MGRVAGKVAVVTGATGGIGRSVCELLAEEGATVYALDLADQLPDDLADWPDRGITYLPVDVTEEAQVEQAVDSIVREAGRLDVVVNNAGITGPRGPAHQATQDEFDRVFAVNVRGTWLCTKHAVTAMLARGEGGSVVNVSSINGIVGGAGVPLYHATKGAVRLMAKADAVTYAKDGIRVNSLHPGSIATPLSDEVAAGQPGGAEQYLENLIAAHPLGRRGDPEDIAYGVLYLASDESKFVTGTELVIDGGYTAR